MIRRIWSKTDAVIDYTKKLRRYDFGDYEGWLVGDSWQCWRIISTSKVDNEIVQELMEMPADFSAFKVYSIDEMPFESSGAASFIPGWSIKSSGCEPKGSGVSEKKGGMRQTAAAGTS